MNMWHKIRDIFRGLLPFGKPFLRPASKDDVAEFGEDLAVKHLKKNGYYIIERSWRWHRYELDVIARKENIIAFIEVKTRTSTKFGLPQEAVNRKKQKHIMASAKAYAARKRLHDFIIRFDIIAVLLHRDEKPEITHIENAFN